MQGASRSRHGAYAVPHASAAAGSGGACLFGGLQPFLRSRLGPRLDRGILDRRLFDQSSITEKAGDPIGRQRAGAEPMLDALCLQRDPIGVRPVEHRVVGPELFDKAAVTRAARIRDDDAVIGALFRAAARQADLQRHALTFSLMAE